MKISSTWYVRKRRGWNAAKCSISIAVTLEKYDRPNYHYGHTQYPDQWMDKETNKYYTVGQSEIPESPLNWKNAIAGRTRLPKKWFKATRTQDYQKK